MGEPAVLLVWGPLVVGDSYYVTGAHWSWDVTWLSLLFALGPTTVLFGKHTDKIVADQEKGVRTLPVILGEQRSRYGVIATLCTQYVLSIALVVTGKVRPPLLLVLLTVPNLITVCRIYCAPKPAHRPPSYPKDIWPLWFSAHAFGHTRLFTSLFLLGILIDCVLY